MKPARTYPARRDDVALLVIDPQTHAIAERRTSDLPDLLTAGDLLVVNDAATVPASLLGRDEAGHAIEIRLLAAGADESFRAVLFGPGDWHQRTEDRAPPPALPPGSRLTLGTLAASIVAVDPLSPRLVTLRFDAQGDALWDAIYRHGRPVQYSYLAHPLPLWAVQTVYAARPWAFEMPSAGRPLSWEILLRLRRKGIRWASITHAAGLSATGDPRLDAALPLPERFDIPGATVDAIAKTRRRGDRVVAVGTTVVRALEGAALNTGTLAAGPGETDLRIDSHFHPRIVDGILSGIHAAPESHFDLLRAFAPADLLAAATIYADSHDLHSHELGDSMLILPGAAQTARQATGA
ncbi:MAG TPA: S-adenosylmethionine:tRNA ribosyltransferase-isomerase [Polyangia bacterium]|jgi:S-adenosylmethionine:tRNA ribosyltransferase-isomerase|nr:S-adenosylmethionine:tRNA ribosyltransferase-isomerase [Polyangia bacterium]